ncbi:MAG: hypothetical protein RR238_09430, partial [Lachnospiraceae bacterium]
MQIQPNVINEKEVKKIQDSFCEVSNVFALCTDHQGQWITEMSGDAGEVKKIKQLIKTERFVAIYNRVAGNSLEEQVVEETDYPNLYMAAISIRVHQQPIMSWIVCAVMDTNEPVCKELEEIHTRISRKRFDDVLDFLRRISNVVLESKVLVADAEAENRRSQTSQKQMCASLRRTEAVTTIVQLLESEDPIEVIMEDILKISGLYLEVSSAQIFR